MTHRRLAFVSLATIALGLSILFVSRPATSRADGPPPSDIVEEVRTAMRPDGLVIERRVWVDSRLAPDTGAVADEVTGISASSESGFTAQYVMNPAKWRSNQIPVPISYNSSTRTGGLPDPMPGINSAIDQWSGVSSAFRFVYAGTTTASASNCDDNGRPDGINAIVFSSSLRSPTLAQTCTISGGGRIIEFDMQISTSANWGADNGPASGQYDLPSTLLHELGHAAGLGHSNNPSAVMFPTIDSAQMRRTLTDDDLAGLRAQYPGSTPSTPAPSPTPSPAAITMPPFSRSFERIMAGISHD